MRHALVLAALVLLLGGCAEYQVFDSEAYVRAKLSARLGAERAVAVGVPFTLSDDILERIGRRLDPTGSEVRRAAEVNDFIFDHLDLKYELRPTRDARGTFLARKGNCLSFTNLFVGLARRVRLNAFYVEVHDAQRWTYQGGAVVSQGHIVGGVNVLGNLWTYDFLPYRPKAYKNLEPIDDLVATAHFYNNLAAEALIDGRNDEAERLVHLATEIAPDFARAANNLGVVLARRGFYDEALAVFRQALETHPDDPALLTNTARAHQQLGEEKAAEGVLAKLEEMDVTNPFFYVYQGEMALERGDLDKALEYMGEALRRDSELPEVHVGLVKVYVARGDLHRARHHLARALKLDATHPEARRFARMLDVAAGAKQQP